MSAEEWKGILRDGEEILWQGKPDGGIYVHRSRRPVFRSGLFFAAFSMVILIITITQGAFMISLIATLFMAFGLFMALSQSYWPAYKRRHTFYTLTNQRAILGIALPRLKRSLKTFEIEPDARYEFIPGPPGSIIFDYEDEGFEINDRPQLFAAGFMRFQDADKVWAMIRNLQEGNRPSEQEQEQEALA